MALAEPNDQPADVEKMAPFHNEMPVVGDSVINSLPLKVYEFPALREPKELRPVVTKPVALKLKVVSVPSSVMVTRAALLWCVSSADIPRRQNAQASRWLARPNPFEVESEDLSPRKILAKQLLRKFSFPREGK